MNECSTAAKLFSLVKMNLFRVRNMHLGIIYRMVVSNCLNLGHGNKFYCLLRAVSAEYTRIE
jgi:hypothetical protein